jgi:hypothetical protein
MPTVAYSLEEILDALDRFHQRATYGAVGGLLDRNPQNVMSRSPRDARHSWVVNQETRMPSGYRKTEIHPDIIERAKVITSPEELEGWLRNPS